jgi:hypothetical protein
MIAPCFGTPVSNARKKAPAGAGAFRLQKMKDQ